MNLSIARAFSVSQAHRHSEISTLRIVKPWVSAAGHAPGLDLSVAKFKYCEIDANWHDVTTDDERLGERSQSSLTRRSRSVVMSGAVVRRAVASEHVMTGLIAAIVVLADRLIEYSTAAIALSYVYGMVRTASGRWQAMLVGRAIRGPLTSLDTMAVPKAPVGCCCTAGAGA